MSYLSPIDAAQVYFEPRDVEEDERPRCEPDDDRGRDRRERFDRLEDARERFELFERDRLENEPGPHPLPRL